MAEFNHWFRQWSDFTNTGLPVKVQSLDAAPAHATALPPCHAEAKQDTKFESQFC